MLGSQELTLAALALSNKKGTKVRVLASVNSHFVSQRQSRSLANNKERRACKLVMLSLRHKMMQTAHFSIIPSCSVIAKPSPACSTAMALDSNLQTLTASSFALSHHHWGPTSGRSWTGSKVTALLASSGKVTCPLVLQGDWARSLCAQLRATFGCCLSLIL